MKFSEVEIRVLRYLEQRFLASGQRRAVMPDEIIADNGITPTECARLVARFKTLGVAEEISEDGTLWINDAVCHYVAELDRESPLPQNPRPIVNVMNIGQVSHSQIQQGTVGSTQTSFHEKAESEVAKETNPLTGYNLSSEARTLLVEASQDANGKVTCSRTMWGQSVQTHGREFVEQGNPRSEAKWKQAVSDLASCELLEDRGHKGEVFGVTGMPALQDNHCWPWRAPPTFARNDVPTLWQGPLQRASVLVAGRSFVSGDCSIDGRSSSGGSSVHSSVGLMGRALHAVDGRTWDVVNEFRHADVRVRGSSAPAIHGRRRRTGVTDGGRR